MALAASGSKRSKTRESAEAARDMDIRSSQNDGPQGPISLSLDSSIDLAGNQSAERLVVDEKELFVLGGEGLNEKRRWWSWGQIEDLQVDLAIGSCYLQIRFGGQWVDVLRCPGGVDRRLTELVDRLTAHVRLRGESRDTPPLSDHRQAVWSHVASERHSAGEQPRHWNTAGRLLAMMRPFRGRVLLLLGLSLAAVTVEVAPPMLQRFLVDRVLYVDQPGQDTSPLLLLLLAIVGGLLLVRLAATLVAVWKGRISSQVGTTLTANLRDELVRKLNELPLAFHDRNQVGMLMSRVAYDTETLHTLVYHMTSGFLLQSLQLVGIGVMLFYLNAKLALVTMLPMPLILAGSWYFTRYLNPRNNHYWEAVGKQASALTGMLSGIRVVKAFVQEDRENQRFCESSRRLRDSRQTVDVSSTTFAALMGFLFALGGLAVWYIGGRDVLFGQMTLGSLMAFLAYLAMFYTPLTTIAESTTWFSNFFTTSRRIFDILDLPGDAEDAAPAARVDCLRGRVEFQGVSFGYDKNRPVLKEVSFTIEPGAMIGIVGRSGSGKSTLVSLIGRLYEIDAGRILVDGLDVREIGSRQLRRRIGMVPQEPFLFRGPLADNITYGDAEAAPEDILRAAQYADAHDFIMRMPFAYETQLGEGGVGLSGGERQRLSIARALLFDPSILILDEATASVDAESERAICDAIRRFSRQRTTIAIAHRLSTLQNADRLIVFDQGRLIEQGTHQELLAHGGVYGALVKIQGNLRESLRHVQATIDASDASGNCGKGTLAEWADGGVLFDSPPLVRRTPGPLDQERAGEGDSRELRWLDPQTASIAGEEQALLRVAVGGQVHQRVSAVRAFPASHPHRYLSLRRRDASGREVEIGLLHSLNAWPRVAREAIERSLARRYLFREIREIRQVQTSAHQLVLSLITDGGPVRLELDKCSEGFQPFGKHGLLLTDAEGHCYVLRDRGALPKHQRRLLTLYFGD
jgi:ATP-binding cassette subfamily B protein